VVQNEERSACFHASEALVDAAVFVLLVLFPSFSFISPYFSQPPFAKNSPASLMKSRLQGFLHAKTIMYKKSPLRLM
jgi:hypothetical protein